MKKTLMSVALASALAVGFSGCVGGASNVVPVKVQTNTGEKLHLVNNYIDSLSKKEVTVEEFKKNIIPTFNKDKRYTDLEFFRCNEYYYCEVQGRKTDLTDNMINLYFIKGLGYKNTYKTKNEHMDLFNINSEDSVRSIAKFEIPFTFEAKENKYIIDAVFPNDFDNLVYGKYGFADYPALASAENMKADAHKSFKNLNNITISRNYELQSEVNSKYDNKSIEANFDRLLKRFNTMKYAYPLYFVDLMKYEKDYLNKITINNPHVLVYNKELFPIDFKVYPYRGGSKVSYTIYLNYKLNADGTSTLTEKDLENIKKEVEKIVND